MPDKESAWLRWTFKQVLHTPNNWQMGLAQFKPQTSKESYQQKRSANLYS